MVIACMVAALALLIGVWRSLGDVTARVPPEMASACTALLTIDDLSRACPDVRNLQDLRIDVESVLFPSIAKCSMSILASGGHTFYAVADAFASVESALTRMRGRTKRVVDDLVIAPGNLFGFGEASALYNQYGGSIVSFQRDHVYVEFGPTGGRWCSDTELIALGKLLYERVARVPSFGR